VSSALTKLDWSSYEFDAPLVTKWTFLRRFVQLVSWLVARKRSCETSRITLSIVLFGHYPPTRCTLRMHFLSSTFNCMVLQQLWDILTSAYPVRTVLFVLYHIMVFSCGICSLPLVLMLFFCCNYLDATLSHNFVELTNSMQGLLISKKSYYQSFIKLTWLRNCWMSSMILHLYQLADIVYSIELLFIE